jgi:membrane protein required for colicin V production
MNWVDYVILAIIGISVIIGVLRGFTREALSLIGWVVAIWVTVTFSDKLELLFVPYVNSPPLRLGLAVVILVLVTLLVAALVNHLAAELIEKSGLTGTDRIIGVVFGFLRGFAVVVTLVLLAGITELPREQAWKHSQLMHYFERPAVWLRTFLPPEVAASISY